MKKLEFTRFPRIVRDTEKSPTYAYSKTKGAFRYEQLVEWPDGEQTLLFTEKLSSGHTLYRTEGRYEIGSQIPNITATDKQVLLSKVYRRWTELQTQLPKDGLYRKIHIV